VSTEAEQPHSGPVTDPAPNVSVVNTWPTTQGASTPPAPGDVPEMNALEFFDACVPYFHEEAFGADPEKARASWAAWRVFIAAAFGLPCPEDLRYPGLDPGLEIPRGAANIPDGSTGREIYKLCTGRDVWPEKAFREVAMVVGRRGGKSFVAAVIAVYLACCKHYALGLGQKGMVQILARDKDQARVIRDYFLAIAKHPMIMTKIGAHVEGETQKLIELSNGIVIEVRAASFKGVRGYTVVAALLDEIAFWMSDDTSANPDKAVLRALRPAMLRVKGSMLITLSSPYAQRGVLYETYAKHYGGTSARVLVWQADSLSMNPTRDYEILTEIKDQYEDDPDSARAEYGAFFRDDIQTLFTKSVIDALVSPVVERPYAAGRDYYGFVDPSGGSVDSMTLGIAHVDPVTKKPTLDLLREVRPKFSPKDVSKEFCDTLKTYHITRVVGDAYSGEWVREQFKDNGIVYEVSKLTRSELYLEMLPLVNGTNVDLLDSHRLVSQLVALERRTGRGRDVVDHPPGAHDDVSNAAAGAVVGCHTAGSSRLNAVTW
jgi:hypothetical protein